MNPEIRKDVVAGWVAVRDGYLYFTLEYDHVQIPTHKEDPHDYNYPTRAAAGRVPPLLRTWSFLGG
ncbi:MAG: hypothetical protein U0361_06375 [Nitrospiraceae bacterium]